MRLLLPGLAACEAADDGHEDRDDALRMIISMLFWCGSGGVGAWLTETMALMTVTIALTTAMKHDVMAFTTLLNCGCVLAKGGIARLWEWTYAGGDSTHICGRS